MEILFVIIIFLLVNSHVKYKESKAFQNGFQYAYDILMFSAGYKLGQFANSNLSQEDLVKELNKVFDKETSRTEFME